jgi:hypothetical protein
MPERKKSHSTKILTQYQEFHIIAACANCGTQIWHPQSVANMFGMAERTKFPISS